MRGAVNFEPEGNGIPAAKRSKRRRIIKAVLDNFLGTYTSRYSDFHGYWLFGFLVKDLGLSYR